MVFTDPAIQGGTLRIGKFNDSLPGLQPFVRHGADRSDCVLPGEVDVAGPCEVCRRSVKENLDHLMLARTLMPDVGSKNRQF